MPQPSQRSFSSTPPSSISKSGSQKRRRINPSIANHMLSSVGQSIPFSDRGVLQVPARGLDNRQLLTMSPYEFQQSLLPPYYPGSVNLTDSQTHMPLQQTDEYSGQFLHANYSDSNSFYDRALRPYMMVEQQPEHSYANTAPFQETVGENPTTVPAYQYPDIDSLYSTSPMQGTPDSFIEMDHTDRSNTGTPLTMQSPDLVSEDEGEEVDGHDKPYARLIWEALMQAPEHKMLLRDIYNWFKQNTKKAQDSGTNGWQNSIRHNLSMNQAFVNDKSETGCVGMSKKANSMWMLTDYAATHGVQSTTRYRKAGSVKKNTGSKIPAIQRQSAGARGGRAARRAARFRKQEKTQGTTTIMHRGAGVLTSPTRNASPLSTFQDSFPIHCYSPLTPTDNPTFDLAYQQAQFLSPFHNYGTKPELANHTNALFDPNQPTQSYLNQPLLDRDLEGTEFYEKFIHW